MRKQTVVRRLSKNAPQIITVQGDATVEVAARVMRDHKIGCLVVVDGEGKLAGILSERDIINRVFGDHADPAKMLVREVMITEVVSCAVHTPLSEVQKVMTSRRIRHLPIVENGAPVGMISSREVMAHQHAKDQAMKAAAEQVARLSTSLKTLDLDEVVTMITREVPSVFRARKSVLCFPQEDGTGKKTLRINRAACLCPDVDLRRREDAKEAFQKSQAILGDPPSICGKLGARGPNVTIPLSGAGLTPGCVGCTGTVPGFLCMCDFEARGEAEQELIQYKVSLLQDILSANLINAKLYQEYQKAKHTAMTDALTGVGTRRFFEDHLEAECARACRYKRPFCVAIWDLDNFKAINDSLGHAGGDKALREFCEAVRREKRASDVLARYGGDEFILLMPETNLDAAMPLLERIRSRVQSILLPKDLSMTSSCGVVAQDVSLNVSSNELVRRADLALYQAKRSGRNRIARWDQMPGGLKCGSYVESTEVKQLKERVTGLLAQSEMMLLQSIWGLVRALDARDPYTKSHSVNVMRYAVGIAEVMEVSPPDIDVIRRAAMVHDVGKMGLPDSVLRKPGKLSPQERQAMEQHPLIAVSILGQMAFLEREIPLVRHHHEHWDGQGYPDRIAGTTIEPGARLLAVADAFDAITSTRAYHEAKGLAQAMQILVQGAGNQFDPDVVAAMEQWVNQVGRQIAKGADISAQDLLDSQESCVLAA